MHSLHVQWHWVLLWTQAQLGRSGCQAHGQSGTSAVVMLSWQTTANGIKLESRWNSKLNIVFLRTWHATLHLDPDRKWNSEESATTPAMDASRSTPHPFCGKPCTHKRLRSCSNLPPCTPEALAGEVRSCEALQRLQQSGAGLHYFGIW